jgi:putative Mg2+ transporter-C (MgtC) family protein
MLDGAMLEKEFLGGLVLPFPVLLLRMVGAAALCALIGYERETHGRSAGLRTNMIVGLASACYALITLQLVDLYTDRGEAVRMDPLRLVEATTSGVAFLAAGMIVLTRGRVKNLTTGALLWLSAAIGLAAGSGVWPVAVLAAVLGLLIVRLRGGQPQDDLERKD